MLGWGNVSVAQGRVCRGALHSQATPGIRDRRLGIKGPRRCGPTLGLGASVLESGPTRYDRECLR
eukprot:354848-Chlamydomonas_euryale.AAC.4